MNRFQKICLSISAFFVLTMPAANACTLFAAQGTMVQGGGTVIVKNRDWKPEFQEMKYAKGTRYQYYGLYGGNEEKMQLRGGVNEKGLVVFSAAASVIPKGEKKLMEGSKKSALKEMLGSAASVEEALQMTNLFLGPKFLMIADKDEVAYVEIGDHGTYEIKRVKNGTLAHTNHYLEETLTQYNKNKAISSHRRYERISELLKEKDGNITLPDLISYSQDQNDGPNNSIYRLGSTPTSTQTLATIGVWIHQDAPPDIYVKIRYNPEDQGKEDVYQLEGKDLFPQR